jgi:hypothetical protein
VNNVKSVRANVYFRWPREFSVPEGASREEESRMIKNTKPSGVRNPLAGHPSRNPSPRTRYRYRTGVRSKQREARTKDQQSS